MELDAIGLMHHRCDIGFRGNKTNAPLQSIHGNNWLKLE
jgi:hypothetical protein